MAVLMAHMRNPPPSVLALRPDLPAAVDQVIAKGMAKAPDDRYATCGDFADALREALGLTSYHPADPSPYSSRDTPAPYIPGTPPPATPPPGTPPPGTLLAGTAPAGIRQDGQPREDLRASRSR